jgi:hypothetical protein
VKCKYTVLLRKCKSLLLIFFVGLDFSCSTFNYYNCWRSERRILRWGKFLKKDEKSIQF